MLARTLHERAPGEGAPLVIAGGEDVGKLLYHRCQ
jgi:hypothetical protein